MRQDHDFSQAGRKLLAMHREHAVSANDRKAGGIFYAHNGRSQAGRDGSGPNTVIDLKGGTKCLNLGRHNHRGLTKRSLGTASD